MSVEVLGAMRAKDLKKSFDMLFCQNNAGLKKKLKM
jgi:hypothetical protein